jgi:molybdopterin molybdotransferase
VFELFARPALLAMVGAGETLRPRAPVVLDHDYRKQAGRAHYVRARLERRGGELRARALTHQGSGMLTSMAGIDALVEVPAESTGAAAGDTLDALLLRTR